jgi:hypothetical protein
VLFNVYLALLAFWHWLKRSGSITLDALHVDWRSDFVWGLIGFVCLFMPLTLVIAWAWRRRVAVLPSAAPARATGFKVPQRTNSPKPAAWVVATGKHTQLAPVVFVP